mmetsp:Transcript_10535/g.23940  ORF Transcript_10535/g.23940 Transcript_10535/m.23940 type:complete len:556 (-) Transcript_10535:94-1761(-)|eukprot:CAMPEP_0178423862 /NCGR_PEP_ID=MMETSP0689_2-20121128/27907_1 /TAXON_ID=160604 /ORGANISM="Amphidinium massartii, Strain CS-259" /LENGTH=555 /DNA_ID=CAMNT_0020045469 /DNA_START=99 /DNA_END=1766 /DNA_ORIENTATION=+
MGLLEPPELTTVLRWVLRAILVSFLVWLVRRRQEDDEDEEDGEQEAEDDGAARRLAQTKSGRAARPVQGMTRQAMQRRNEPYANQAANLRQRRPGGAEDVNDLIDRVSKPKEMWEARKSGEPLQIRKQNGQAQPAPPPVKQETGPSGASPLSALLSTTASQSSPSAVSGSLSGGIPPGGGTKIPHPSNGAKEERLARAREEQKNMLHGHSRPVTCITWNKDGNLLFTCGKDKLVCVWSFPDGECLGKYTGHSGAVWSCSITADSRWLVSGGADNQVIVWEARMSRELARVELPGVVRCVEWAGGSRDPSEEEPVSSELLVTSNNKFGREPPQLMVWKFEVAGEDGEGALSMVSKITGLPTAASQVRWGLGDETLASAHENGEMVFWRVDDGTELRRLKVHDGVVSKFDFSSDHQVLVTVSLDKSIKLWDLAEGSEGKLLFKSDMDRPLNGVAFGPLIRRQVVGSADERPKSCCLIAAGGQDVRDVAGSSVDGQFETLLLNLGSSKDFPAELEVVGSVKGHFGPVHTLAFSADGKAIASGSEDGYVRLHTFDKHHA